MRITSAHFVNPSGERFEYMDTNQKWHTYWISYSYVNPGVVGFGACPYDSLGPLTPDLITGELTNRIEGQSGIHNVVVMSVSLLSVED
jgi:hypothetical protein